jgi:L-rhamnose mutarotase
MQRFGMMIRLKAGSASTSKRYHAAVWPEVLDKILECNIRNYSIYFKGYFEYHGCDLKSDWKKMDSHAKTQE